MHHGDDMQQVVRQLLHVDVLVALVLLLGRVFAAHAVCVGGAGFREEGEELGAWVLEGLGTC
jgi:hypothetical protein